MRIFKSFIIAALVSGFLAYCISLFVDAIHDPYRHLNNTISYEISTAKKGLLITDASVYVQDLTTGRSYGYQENKRYEPRSMFKVTDLMAYLRESISDPSIMEEMRTYNPFFGRGVHYEPKRLEFGQYSVSVLLAQLITQSDDAALQALNRGDESAKILSALGFPPFVDGKAYFISPKNAAKMFSSLYYNTLLPDDLSTQALDLLSRTTFTQGIVSGVPSGVRVAHKFGENAILGDKGGVKGHGLNDCGIVFAHRPYVICVMTLGPEFSGLETAIQNISRAVYDDISVSNDK